MALLRRKRKIYHLRTPRFFRHFRRNTASSFRKGNRVQLFPDGGEFYPAMLQAFLSAQHTLHVEFYIIKNDGVGGIFAEALLAAAARGVTVRLIYDYIGCFDTPATYFKRLEDGGVLCLPFNPLPCKRGFGWWDKRDHRKMAIIDGRSAFVCSINIADEYARSDDSRALWRDVGVRVDGPAAADLEELFRENWNREGGDVPPEWGAPAEVPEVEGGAEVMVVSGGPHHTRSFIRSAFRMTMAGAADTIRVINPYFIPGPRVIRSFLRAAGRGVRVQMILPSRSDVPLVKLVSRSCYAQLLKAGVQIFELEGTILHAKVMLVDDCWSIVGSANLDHRSFHRNFELNVIVDSHDFGAQLADMFVADLARSRRIHLDEHEKRGAMIRLLERLFSPLSWFL